MKLAFIILSLVILVFIGYVVYMFNSNHVLPYAPQHEWRSKPSTYEGMTGMSYDEPLGSENIHAVSGYNKLDQFGLIESSMQCKDSGYYNLKGNACLSEEQTRLLMTRGGNSSAGTKYEKDITK